MTDACPGVFDKVKHAMQLLKEHNLPFGISTCYTSMNYKDITSEEFYDMIIEAGAFIHLVLPLYASWK